MQFARIAMVAGFSVLAFAQARAAASSPLDTTIDLLAPATPCSGSNCPSDINLPILSAPPLGSYSFTYASSSGTSPISYLATIGLDNTNSATYPVVCDEMSGSNIGPTGPTGFTTNYSNAVANGGGALAFGAGGTNLVDMSSLSYSNSSGQPGISLIFSNTPTKQVTCYPALQIGAVANGTSTPVLASNGTAAGDRVFAEGFENPLSAGAGEPWISALTVGSLSSSSNKVVYVLQIHNASTAAASAWHVDFGYDTAYFGASGGSWCVIPPTAAQPGSVPNCGIVYPMLQYPTYSVASRDVHKISINGNSADDTDSVYLQVTLTAPVPPSTPITNWPTLPASFYPALGALFPPAGVYPQRLDNKVAVASASNVPVQNIGSISCTNVATPVCMLTNPDGAVSPVSFANSVSGAGVATIDPLIYFVDPSANTTSPGIVSGGPSPDALSMTGLTCSDPQNVLTSPTNSVTISQSTNAAGAQALGFTFAPGSGVPYQSGTATCTATFANSGYSPALTNIVTFSIEMQKASLASVALATSTAGPVGQGSTVSYTLTVTNAGNAALSNIPVSDNPGSGLTSVVWNSCVPIGSGTCPASLVSGNSQTIPSLPNNGDGVTFSLTGTVGSITSPPLQLVGNTASISVPGGSCAGGSCTTPAVTVATVPIVGVSNSPASQSYASGVNPYTVKVSNEGGTAVSGLALGTLVNPNSSATVALSGCTAGTGNSSTAADGTSMSIAGGDNVSCTATATITTPPTTGNQITITSVVSLGSASPNTAVCDSSSCQTNETITP